MSDGTDRAASAGPPPTADPQDPLPESSFRYRRILVFAGELLRTVALAYILHAIARSALSPAGKGVEELFRLGELILLYGLVDRILYLVAPSAEQIVKIVQMVGALKAGVIFRQTARAEGPQGSASSTSTAGAPLGVPVEERVTPAAAEAPRDPWEPRP